MPTPLEDRDRELARAAGAVAIAVLERGEGVTVLRARRGDADVVIAAAEATNDLDAEARFREEARRIDAACRGEGTVALVDVGSRAGARFAVRPFVSGAPLDTDGARPLLSAVALLDPIARALGRAHRAGVAHRALSPARIVVEASRATLVDLSVGALFPLPRAARWSSPEQLDARVATPGPAVDVYALALLFLELASGKPAYGTNDALEIYPRAVDRSRRPSLAALGIAAAPTIERVLERALAVDPEARFADADAFWGELRDAVGASPQPIDEPPRPRVAETKPATPPNKPRAPIAIAAAAASVVVAAVFAAESLLAPKRASETAATAAASAPIPPPPKIALSASVAPAASSAPPKARALDELPVPVDAPVFFVDRTEVTVRAYRACVQAGACTPTYKRGTGFREDDPVRREWLCNYWRAGREDHPVNCISFFQATAYCTFHGKRLPTGAEWTRAASGGEARKYPWGASFPSCREVVFARYGPTNPGCDKQPIGTAPADSHPKTASPFGALDMAGSLWEWTTETSDRGLPILRGGAWDSPETKITIDSRLEQSHGNADVTLGFRCVRDA